ncbi:MAG: TRAP transporter large permease [Oscillospiraceae bacterium]|jgi:tripartite ATP-independent transporter DctM subunit|nr:TRAP transporter large permease [Oscillospiraceae bacterium]
MTTASIAIAVLLGGFVVLMLLRVPVSIALILSTLGSALIGGTNLTSIAQAMVKGVDNFSLLAVPFFILSGEIISAGGIATRLIDLANLLVGRMRGGLAMVNCMDSMFFGGISGSAVADVSSLGSVMIPMMVKAGYDEDFAVGITVTTACQGVLIPPSHNMVIYAVSAGGGISIGKLFMGGLIPGVLLGLAFMVTCYILAKRRNYPYGVTTPKGKRLKVVLEALLPLGTILIVMGGVSFGICTPTESAALAGVYAFILAYFVFREIKLRDFGKILTRALKTLAIVLTLIAAAKGFAFMMVNLRVSEILTSALLSVTQNKYLLLLLINVLLLFLGCIMDMAPLILIMTPILYPVVTSPVVGMDPIHFGVMLIFNLAIGLCTPPVGSALFVGCAIGKTPIERTAKHMMPMFLTMVIMLMLVTYIPDVTMLVPRLMTAK